MTNSWVLILVACLWTVKYIYNRHKRFSKALFAGQLIKYVKSLNKDKVDAFNAMCVESHFFSTAGTATSLKNGKKIVDTEYDRQISLLEDELYSGLIINFNQKTATLDFMKLQDTHPAQPTKHATFASSDVLENHVTPVKNELATFVPSGEFEKHVAVFCRCCIEPTDNDADVIQFYQMVKEYESFTGLPIPSVPLFKHALTRHVRARRQTSKVK